MLILGLLGMYFDAAVVCICHQVLTFFQIACGHTVTWHGISKLSLHFGCLFFAILLGQIKSKLNYRLVTYNLANP